jgi:tyrosyl-tRNA synthetase
MFSKAVSTDVAKIDELLTRSVAEIIPGVDSLRELLMSGTQLRIKLGIDPTSPSLHIGRGVPILKLRDFQQLGHKVVFIIGDATGVVGDTSDKDAERPMLTKTEVEKNLASYVAQITQVLDRGLMEVRRNSEWLLKLDYGAIGDQADSFSLADFSARDNIRRRLDEGKRVSLREVLYPLMQGYDSVAVKADVELGSTDQRFNLLAGRTLQEKAGQAPQHIVMTELIPGTDGRKMSSSWGNTINLNDAPDDMFGTVMAIPDTLTEPYLIHTTRIPLGTVRTLMAGHPKDTKMALAEELVRMYHGEAVAKQARANFESTFSRHEVPTDIPTVTLNGRDLAGALVAAGIVESKSDYRRLEKAGAVTTLSDDASGKVLKIGKHRFVKITK